VTFAQSPADDRPQRLRLDKWLWHARFFKTRSLAARFVEDARIRLDGRVVERPSAAVAPGSVLTLALGNRVRVVRVLGLGTRRGPAPEARSLYADLGEEAPPEVNGNPAGVILAPQQRTR